MNNDKIYYCIYKITNLINNKIYIGSHKTKNVNDSYMGSGTILKKSIEKYGIENFKKEILHIFNNSSEMYNKEAEIVNNEFLKRNDVYNIKIGGLGGWDFINQNGKNLYGLNGKTPNVKHDLARGRSTTNKLRRDPLFAKKYNKKISNSLKAHYKENGSHWLGKKHTKETKEKIGAKSRIHQSGKNNSQYGTMWIHNPTTKENRKIKKTDVIPNGFAKGQYKKPKPVKPSIRKLKLEERKIRAKEIYKLHLDGLSTRQIAKIYNKSHVTISKEINFYKSLE